MDVPEALLDYLQAIGHLARRTRVIYQQRLMLFADWCSTSSITLEQINHRRVQTFLVWLRDTRKPSKHGQVELSSFTITGYVGCISAFLHWCLDDEEYSQVVKLQVIRAIKMPKRDVLIKDTLTDEEIAALFDACSSADKQHEYQLRDIAILAVLLDTGIRAEELRTLSIGNVTLARVPGDDSYIKVMGKGRKEREIPLGNKSRRALQRYIRQYRKGALRAESVFLSRHGGQMAHETLKDMLLRLKAHSGLPEDAQINPHKFRHTFATRFMANGGDVYDLSRLMGHSSVAITEGYLRGLSIQQVRKRKDHKSVLDEL